MTPTQDTFVADIRQGDRSIDSDGYSDGVIRVANEPLEPVEILIGLGTGSLSGTVVHPDGKKGADTTVVLVPEGSLRAKTSLHRTALADELGQFTITNVRPGRYKLFAWESMPSGAWLNAQFFAKYEDLGVAVTVSPGQSSGLRVPVTWLKP